MPLVEVSVGELLDKWTVLEIKLRFLSNEQQLSNIRTELNELSEPVKAVSADAAVNALLKALFEVNLAIWHGMDRIDELEQTDAPLSAYTAQALDVTRLNRRRANLKKDINAVSGSKLREEKSYF